MKKNDPKYQDVYLAELLVGPVELGPVLNRHLLAAGVKGDLRVRLASLSQPSDAKDYEEQRSNLGTGMVICPECEGDNEAPCRACDGKGMVNRAQWDNWFFETKSCRNYKEGCWLKCTEPRCSYDVGHAMQMTVVLALESFSAKMKKWVPCGNSIQGFRLKGLAANDEALERYLNLVCETNNLPCFAFDEEDEEE